MASPSGTSSGSSMLQNSGSEEELQQLMDERKLKRKQSNRESARRSRMRKQQHLDDLMAQVAQLRKDNNQILTNLNITTQLYLNVEGENSVLRTQLMELNNRLQSLNEILQCMHMNNQHSAAGFEFGGPQDHADSFLRPWELLFLNQPIMASADLFQY